jgi:putative oxidoreductase
VRLASQRKGGRAISGRLWRAGVRALHESRGAALPLEIRMFMSLEEGLRSRWAPLPLRLVIGYGFMAHGWAKWTRGPEEFARLLQHVHVPLPQVTAWIVTLLEFFGGLAILAGAFVALVSLPLVISMLVAMLTVQLRYGFSSVNTIGLTDAGPVFGPPGYEINLLYIAGLLVLVLGGAGPLSVDHWLARRRKAPASNRALPGVEDVAWTRRRRQHPTPASR